MVGFLESTDRPTQAGPESGRLSSKISLKIKEAYVTSDGDKECVK